MFTSACNKKYIFRKAPPSVVSGYGKRSINLNKVVATFEKHIFLSQTDLTCSASQDLPTLQFWSKSDYPSWSYCPFFIIFFFKFWCFSSYILKL
jgi:hypothetical protein